MVRTVLIVLSILVGAIECSAATIELRFTGVVTAISGFFAMPNPAIDPIQIGDPFTGTYGGDLVPCCDPWIHGSLDIRTPTTRFFWPDTVIFETSFTGPEVALRAVLVIASLLDGSARVTGGGMEVNLPL